MEADGDKVVQAPWCHKGGALEFKHFGLGCKNSHFLPLPVRHQLPGMIEMPPQAYFDGDCAKMIDRDAAPGELMEMVQ